MIAPAMVDQISEAYNILVEKDAANFAAEEKRIEAVTEYETRKKNGTLDRLKLTSKYIQAGRLLESQVDQRFLILLNHMAAELRRKNLDGAIIAEIEELYAQTKADKKKELFNRLRNRLKQ